MADIELGDGLSTPVHGMARVAFEIFFRATYIPLIRVARYFGASPQEAEDAASQTMIEVLNRWSRINDPKSWAYRAVIHNYLNTKRRDGERNLRAVAGGHAHPEAQTDLGLTVWEDKEWVTQILSSLPLAQKAVMTYVIDGLKPDEIGLLLGKSPAAVRKNLERARDRLRRELANNRATEAISSYVHGSRGRRQGERQR